MKVKEIVEKIQSGERSAVSITEEFLERIQKSDGELNAYITVTSKQALEAARRVDEKVKNHEPLGKLAGVPISIKDNIAVKDVTMTCGSKMLENFVVPYTASLVQAIEKEDGIVLGKVNMDEFAMGADTRTSAFGMTKNPLDTTRIPGGSSGGSAAAVAGEECVLSVGTDTGGSVRQPAALCGCVGMKPTYGSISRYGVAAMANSFDQPGALGHCVEDVALLLEVMASKDEKDATNCGNPRLKEVNFEGASLEGLSFAIPRLVSEQALDETVKKGFDHVVNTLTNHGAKVQVVEMPSLSYGIETYHVLVNGEIAPNMSRYDGLRYGYRAEGEFENIEDFYIANRSAAFGDEVKRRVMVGTHILSLDHAKEYYEKAQEVRAMMKEEYRRVFENYDFVLCPTYPTVAYRLDESLTPVQMYAADLFTVSVNIAGICGISLPVDVGDALPGAVQIIGNHFEDDRVLKAAYALERSLAHGM